MALSLFISTVEEHYRILFCRTLSTMNKAISGLMFQSLGRDSVLSNLARASLHYRDDQFQSLGRDSVLSNECAQSHRRGRLAFQSLGRDSVLSNPCLSGGRILSGEFQSLGRDSVLSNNGGVVVMYIL